MKAGEHLEREIKVYATKMIPPFKPLTVKRFVKPIKDQKVVMKDGGFVTMKPPKFQTYSFISPKSANIYEELVKIRVTLLDSRIP